jgi:hypothetical protein
MQTKQHIKMNKNPTRSNNQLAADPLSDYFNERPFILDDEDSPPPKSREKPSQKKGSENYKIQNFFNIQTMTEAHITTVLLADQIIKE